MGVPLQQRIGRPAQAKRVAVHLPHRVQRRVIVRIQRKLFGGFVIETDYLGSAGHRLYNQNNINRYAGDLLDGRFNGFNSSFAAVNYISASANSIYHGASLTVTGGAGSRRRATLD